MKTHRSFWLAWSGFALTAVVGIGAIFLMLVPVPGQPADVLALFNNILNMVNAVMTALVGAIVAVRLRHNPVGWLFIIAGLALAAGGILSYCAQLAYWTGTETLFGGLVAAWASQWVWQIPSIALILLLFLFPTGTFLSRRWRWAGLASAITEIGVMILFAFSSPIYETTFSGEALNLANPIGLLEWGDPSWRLVQLAIVAPILAALAGTLFRFVRARGVEREQMKWVLYAASLLAIGLIINIIFPNEAINVLVSLISIALPVAVGIAILRYRLWDIDILIRRTVTYTIVIAILAMVYFASIILLEQVFAALSRQHSEYVTVLSTLAIAALFVPLRKRIQNAIDKRFNREKYDAQRVLQEFGESVRDETDLETLVNHLIQVVDETMQPRSISVWLRQGERR